VLCISYASITTGISEIGISEIGASIFTGEVVELLVEIASTDRRSDELDTGGGSDRRDEADGGDDVTIETSVVLSLDLLDFSLFC